MSNAAVVHAVMRLGSMSDRALSARAENIARGQSANSKEKMLVFYYALLAGRRPEIAARCWQACAPLNGIEGETKVKAKMKAKAKAEVCGGEKKKRKRK